MENLYVQYPELLAYMAVVDGKLVFDFDDRKVTLEQMMLALHSVTGEYLKALAEQTSPNNNKENNNGKK